MPLKIRKYYSKGKIYLFIVMAVIGSLFFYLLTFVFQGSSQYLEAPKGKIELEILDDPAERRLGLSGRQGLSDEQGLLFIFDEQNIDNCFWMKDMLFSIDMIWLDEAKRVITIKEGVAPETYPTTFCPDSAAKYGLEVSSGGAERLGVISGVHLAF